MIAGQKYKLLLQYEGSSFRAFLNDQLFYENQKVNYPNGTAIDGGWTGYLGIRLFGNLSKLKVLSMPKVLLAACPSEDDTAEFMKLQEKWQNQLVSDHYDPNNPTMADYLQMVTSEAEALYQTINKASDRTSLWPLEQGNTASADVTTQFTKLQKMALAYGTKGSSLYQDEVVATTIIDGIDFMVTRKGYDGEKVPWKLVGLANRCPAKTDQYFNDFRR